MNKKFSQLIRGQIIVTQVIELQEDHGILVSYRGDLLRVKNSSGKLFSVGEKIRLQVVATDPLEFKIYDGHSFDRMI